MNINKFIKLMLLVSIVFQSCITVLASIETHQLDIEHLQTVHDHTVDYSQNNGVVAPEQHDTSDCHHCGHCSSGHTPWIMEKAVIYNPVPVYLSPIQKLAIHPNNLPPGIYRPPIS